MQLSHSNDRTKAFTAWNVVPIILGFTVASIAFSVVVPVLEAPDETSHVAVVRYIRAHAALPVQRPDDFPAGQEGSQPPLYYILGSLLWRLAPGPDLAPTFREQNPFVTFSRLAEPAGNRNLYAHAPREDFPYQGDVRGIHLIRLLSVALASIAVALTFLIARDLFPDRPLVAPLAVALVAFNPQFVFISSVVNNDGAIAAAAALVLWCLVRWLVAGGSTPLAVALGACLGAAMLAKTDGILLVPLAAVVLLADALLARRFGQTLTRVSIVAALPVGVAGWWFVRNLVLYGDPMGWDAMLAANGGMIRNAPVDVWAAAKALWDAHGSYWGIFGWTNVPLSDRIYQLLDVASGVALIGLAIALWRVRLFLDEPRRALALAVVLVWPPLVFASLVRWVQINNAADQWRLMFAAITAMGILMALGLDEILWLATRSVAVVAASVRNGRRGRVGKPTTRRPEGRAQSRAAEAGARTGPRQRDLARSSRRLPFKAATVVCRHALETPSPQHSPPRPAPAALGIALAILGTAANLVVLAVVIAPTYYPTAEAIPSSATLAALSFGSDVELVGYDVHPTRLDPGGALEVDLQWRARRPPTRNWTVAVSLLGSDDAPLAKAEGWPQAGRAPTTAWRVGEVYRDRYLLVPRWQSADPQLARVWLSLYDGSIVGGPGLPVVDGKGQTIGTGVALAPVKLPPTEAAAVSPQAISARLGPSIDLVGYDVVRSTENLRVTLDWCDRAPVAEAYTVFVHVIDSTGKVVAQHDGPPREGSYPTTAWEIGETIRDEHVVPLAGLPAGRYRVVVGLYRPTTGERLSATSGTGVPVVDNGVQLFELNVS